MNLKQHVQALTATLESKLIAVRQHLHAHPELSFQEEKTAAFIAEQLKEAGIRFTSNIGGHGIAAIIEGKNPDKKNIALRGDMDALPITEQNNVVYKSCNTGVMHACGHDVHTTCVLGAALLLQQLSAHFEGTVKIIFQPAEERLPGGASLMIKEGVLENPHVETIVGQHVLPQLETGKVAFRAGISMASCDELFITVKGKGGHGAVPQLAIDPVLIASHIVIALQQVVSRNANPTLPSVLTIGKIIGNGATNIIPEEVYMEGTFRTFDEPWRAEAKKKMIQIATSIAEGMGGTCDCRIEHGYPFLKNDETLTENAIKWAKEYLGEENVLPLEIRMTAEDFSYFSQEVPACFYRLGTGNKEKGITSPIHTPTFDVDERCLAIGTGLMTWLALRQLE
ncbi:MAG: amidohydrolase [Chitinophagales bacterium]|nr:amidohydrolase [Chitinophagales bacterium]